MGPTVTLPDRDPPALQVGRKVERRRIQVSYRTGRQRARAGKPRVGLLELDSEAQSRVRADRPVARPGAAIMMLLARMAGPGPAGVVARAARCCSGRCRSLASW